MSRECEEKYVRYETSARVAEITSPWGERGAALEFEVDDVTGQPIAAHLSPTTDGSGLTLHTNQRPHFILPTYAMFGVPVRQLRSRCSGDSDQRHQDHRRHPVQVRLSDDHDLEAGLLLRARGPSNNGKLFSPPRRAPWPEPCSPGVKEGKAAPLPNKDAPRQPRECRRAPKDCLKSYHHGSS
jgi:hypothetical protein